MADKKFTRKDKKIAGVCGGIAAYFGWDANITRVVYTILTLCTAFCGVLAYLVIWILIPEDK